MPQPRTDKCYYCGEPAMSEEHVPPKCLFPEQKDTGKDYRKNLITVPSCDKHNAGKSCDDEFLMACLAPVVGNNGAAFIQTRTKLSRAFTRNPKLLSDVIRKPRHITLMGPNDMKFPVLIGQPDVPRLCKALESVARGIYFHANKKRFKGKVAVIPSFVNYPHGDTMSIIQLLSQRMAGQERDAWHKYGENPDIFMYQFGPVDQFGLIPMVMTFYCRAEAYVSFQPKGVRLPFKNLIDATPENPIHIDITIGSGQDARQLTWECTGK